MLFCDASLINSSGFFALCLDAVSSSWFPGSLQVRCCPNCRYVRCCCPVSKSIFLYGIHSNRCFPIISLSGPNKLRLLVISIVL